MMQKFYLLFICFYGFMLPNLESQVLISEILASNTSTVVDNLSRNYVDCIELYNDSDKSINIGGWFLSDDKNQPAKWKIPYYISIAPKSNEIFWADNLEKSNHTNFKLNENGESLFLHSNDTVLVDAVTFPKQVSDISYGRVADTSDIWHYFSSPSLGNKNLSKGVSSIIFSEEPVFSLPSGFYKKPIKVELSSSSSENEIFYTLDGSTPSQDAILYTKPIFVKETSVIRAKVFSENRLASKTITRTYFINEKFSVPIVSLSTDPGNFWDKEYGIYSKGVKFNPQKKETANYFQDWERPVNIEYFDKSGEPRFNTGVGVKIHGRSTRNYSQKTLAIYFKKKYGDKFLTYNPFSETNLDQIKTFLLRNSGNDWGATMFLDALTHSLVVGKIDIDGQAYQPTVVFINGQYWGIHNLREKINKNYLKTNHNLKSDKIDIIEADAQRGGIQVSKGDIGEYEKLMEFLRQNDLSLPENFQKVKSDIDINELINYLIIQVYIANADWPSSNVKIWKVRSRDSKWRWILYDTEYAYGADGEYYKANSVASMLEDNSEKIINQPWSNYLFRRLFTNEDFKNEFIQRTAIYLNTILKPEVVLETIDSLMKNIEPEIKRSFLKWGGVKQNVAPYLVTSRTVAEWRTNIEQIKGFVRYRADFVRKNILNQFSLRDTVRLEIKMNDKKAGKIMVMGYQLPDGKFNGEVFSGIPIKIVAIPNEGYQFEKWKEGDYARDCSIILNSDKKLTAIFKKTQ